MFEKFEKIITDIVTDTKCHICGCPKTTKGSPFCSYPHGLVPAQKADDNGFVSWVEPKQ